MICFTCWWSYISFVKIIFRPLSAVTVKVIYYCYNWAMPGGRKQVFYVYKTLLQISVTPNLTENSEIILLIFSLIYRRTQRLLKFHFACSLIDISGGQRTQTQRCTVFHHCTTHCFIWSCLGDNLNSNDILLIFQLNYI